MHPIKGFRVANIVIIPLEQLNSLHVDKSPTKILLDPQVDLEIPEHQVCKNKDRQCYKYAHRTLLAKYCSKRNKASLGRSSGL